MLIQFHYIVALINISQAALSVNDNIASAVNPHPHAVELIHFSLWLPYTSDWISTDANFAIKLLAQ